MSKKFFATIVVLLLLTTFGLSQVNNCASNEAYDASNPKAEVSVHFTQQVPGSGLLIWAPAFLPVSLKTVVTFSDDNPSGPLSYAPTMIVPANQMGIGAFSYVENANFTGSTITASFTNTDIANSLIVCELPNSAVSNMLAKYITSTSNSLESVKSAPLSLPQGTYLLAYCAEAGASFMQPFFAGPGFELPVDANSNPTSTVPNGACEFGFYTQSRGLGINGTWSSGASASMFWTGTSLHTSAILAAFRFQ